jgi:eukaryotic-like serine/threonine-protein kinase
VTDAKVPTTPSLEIAHVLFIDIVAYSTLHMDRQQQVLHELQEAVRSTPSFIRAQANDELIRLPTGDGMALVFFHDPEAPVRCAVELTNALSEHPIKLRMGIHTGPVYRVADINTNRNVAGGGINIAQRVMDCGDAGHILISGAEADVLSQISSWSAMLHDLGEVEVKHSVRVHLYNFYADGTGNPEPPKKTEVHGSPAPQLTLRKAKRPEIGVMVLIALTTVAALGGTGGWLFFDHRAKVLGPADTLVMADFTNKTGDPIFDDTLRVGVAVQLKQSPFINLVSGDRIQEALRLMQKPPDSPLTSELAQELCRQIGSKAYVIGSVEGSNGPYTLSLKAITCRTARLLAEDRIEAVQKEGVLRAVSQMSRQVREELGEPKELIQRFDLPLESATSSLEALHAYALGIRVLSEVAAQPEDAEEKAVPLLQEAIRWDSHFGMAYAVLARCEWGLGWWGPATESAKTAYELRDRAGNRERFYIESTQYTYQPNYPDENEGYRLGVVAPRLEQARAVYEDWARTYPRDAEPHRGLGRVYRKIGQYEKALQEFREALRLEPGTTECNSCIVSLCISLNRLSEARAELYSALRKDSGSFSLHRFSYQLAFLQDDAVVMAQEVAWASASANPDTESAFALLEADTAAYVGKLKQVDTLLHNAFNNLRTSRQEFATNPRPAYAGDAVTSHAALLHCLLNSSQECAVIISRLHGTDLDLEFARALAGKREAMKWEDASEEREPQELELWFRLMRAQWWLNRKNPEKAVEVVQAVTASDLRDVSGVYCVYVRGYANLAAPHLYDAEADFKEILDHRGTVANSPVGALAEVGLARARAQKGDAAGAKTSYEHFLTLWKDADPDIPILKQAKAEYAKLQ